MDTIETPTTNSRIRAFMSIYEATWTMINLPQADPGVHAWILAHLDVALQEAVASMTGFTAKQYHLLLHMIIRRATADRYTPIQRVLLDRLRQSPIRYIPAAREVIDAHSPLGRLFVSSRIHPDVLDAAADLVCIDRAIVAILFHQRQWGSAERLFRAVSSPSAQMRVVLETLRPCVDVSDPKLPIDCPALWRYIQDCHRFRLASHILRRDRSLPDEMRRHILRMIRPVWKL